ncbi:superinfection exclusion protein B, partial [Salmonella enterica subsp. enterica serovar Saintpaul]|nr:superinfection exclusion protein B [Salmonella enterica]EBF4065760.1 superinfection exclusion protein B [Salmonella enterica subsp. enterica serovar Saintpaul]EBS1963735.1 superinfection exclusion protein B [Salmonella enterica subsp. enterica serovar Schwarzengrund]ECH8067283.1 superinfection exclusion protein B [Salmonella enterica subsp. enterica serovar Typhimurium]EDL3445784.1 superinfection exclusion protein B [Salmonella enterica subsp. enterica serovar Heidelberg]
MLDCACLLTTSGSVVLVYPYSEKSDKLYSPLQRAKRESPMNNSWWQE